MELPINPHFYQERMLGFVKCLFHTYKYAKACYYVAWQGFLISSCPCTPGINSFLSFSVPHYPSGESVTTVDCSAGTCRVGSYILHVLPWNKQLSVRSLLGIPQLLVLPRVMSGQGELELPTSIAQEPASCTLCSVYALEDVPTGLESLVCS